MYTYKNTGFVYKRVKHINTAPQSSKRL